MVLTEQIPEIQGQPPSWSVEHCKKAQLLVDTTIEGTRYVSYGLDVGEKTETIEIDNKTFTAHMSKPGEILYMETTDYVEGKPMRRIETSSVPYMEDHISFLIDNTEIIFLLPPVYSTGSQIIYSYQQKIDMNKLRMVFEQMMREAHDQYNILYGGDE